MKTRKQVNTRLQWDKDGKDVLDDPNKSMKILIDWQTAGSNWLKYKVKIIMANLKCNMGKKLHALLTKPM